ncbi:putative acyl-CoA dehydrogenase FadE10 [Desulfuromonas versatilis]|uniref:Acyl-CoA dehydrogenase FadE10 n=1 Tax=Desulfuromonas versatilis TaxID=2802975 RepID=A0ABM8HZY9_9BACT|nr:acyl-CoA dehydrogenase family protein [Desulfuromonas versatilis]BCR06235.1 putative acyl-CoA dehydrogenase FadE10 [Desulfuromonas versatilis]
MKEDLRDTGSDARRAMDLAETAREAQGQKPSFLGELFMGRLHNELLFPWPEQEPADKAAGDALLQKLRAFLRERVDADRIDREKNVPAEVIEGLSQLGLFGIKIPGRYGGLGLSQRNYHRILHLVASHCGSTALLLSVHQSIGVAQPLLMFGSEQQKGRYLPRLAAGALSAFALTEPGVGSDPSQMTTTATLSEDGSAWLLNGRKLWTTNGPIAELLIVTARSNDPAAARPEISAFIVAGNSPGLKVEHRCDFMGLKGIQNGLIAFNDVRVPREDLLGGIGEGLRLALRTLNVGRLSIPAFCSAVMKHGLAICRNWGNQRRQWGAPIGQHEAVAAKIARIAADTYAVDSLAWLAASYQDGGGMDLRLEAAADKLFCSEAMWRALDATLQVRGGRGYETADSLRARGEQPMPVERMLRDARLYLIGEGTSEILRLFIAREALDPHLEATGITPLSNRLDLQKALRFYPRWYAGLLWPGHAYPEGLAIPALLKGHLRYLHHAARRLGRDLFHMMLRHGSGLQKRQLVLGRIVDTGVELFAMGAALSRALSPQAPPGAAELADNFCRQARRRIAGYRRALYLNQDRRNYALARSVLAGDLAWLEENILCTWQDEPAAGGGAERR